MARKEPGLDESVTEEEAAGILSSIYDMALRGIPKVSEPIDDYVRDYTSKFDDSRQAARELAKYQILKCGASGFLTGLGGLITLPATVPANIGSVFYVQMRMVAAIAMIGGYDARSDQVQTLVYLCLTGTSITDAMKSVGITIGEKTLTAAIKKIPGTVLTKINQRIGFRLITKFGEKGVINLGKMVPIAGGVIGGAFDVTSTASIANNAINLFIEDGELDSRRAAEIVVEEDGTLNDGGRTLQVSPAARLAAH